MIKDKNKDFKNMLIGFGVIVLYLLSSIFVHEFLDILGINFNKLSDILKQVINIIYEVLLLLIIIYIYRKDIIPNFKKFIKNNIQYFKKYFKYWIFMLILMIISNAIVTLFTSSDISENQDLIIKTLKKAPIYTFILTVLIAPILEELVFRLSFRKIFAHTDILFIIFSGLIFGSMHVLGTSNNLIDLLFIIPYSIPGFVFAYVYTKSKNICVPISLHFIHNGIMMALQILLLILK